MKTAIFHLKKFVAGGAFFIATGALNNAALFAPCALADEEENTEMVLVNSREAALLAKREKDNERRIDWFIGINAGGNFFIPKDGDQINLYGGALTGGFKFAKSEYGSVFCYGEFGAFTATKTIEFTADSFKTDYTFIPLNIVGGYEFNLGADFNLRIGAHAGYSLFIEDCSKSLYLHKEYLFDSFDYGGVLGLSYKFANQWAFDLAYKFSINNFKGSIGQENVDWKIHSHQLTAGVVFLF